MSGSACDRGEFAGLIGSNGAGKTTLLKVILGLQPVSAGTIRLRRPARGRAAPADRLRAAEDPARPRHAAARPRPGRARPGRAAAAASRCRRQAAAQRIDEMLDAVGAAQFGDARVGNLSGGEQQRVLIAHALISRPRLLLLDEPLANLDIASEQDVVALLSRVAREQQIAVLISAHDMNPLLPVMDRIIYLAAGRAASGTTERGGPDRRAQRALRPARGRDPGARPDPGRGRARRGPASAAGPGRPSDGPAVTGPGTAPEVAGPHGPETAAGPGQATAAEEATTTARGG